MVQVLPYVPSFGEQITPVLNEALGKVAKGFGTMQTRKSDQAILEAIRSGKSSDSDLMTLWNRMSPEGRKNNEAFLNSQLRVQENEQKLKQKEESKQRTEETEKAAVRKELIPQAKAIDELIDKAAYGAGGLGASAELDASGFWYTDKVYTHFNKGVVSNVRFETMKKDLAPNSNLPPSVNRRRLAALNRMANLPSDISSEKFDSVMDREIKDVKKAETKETKISEKKGSVSAETSAGERPPLESFG